MAPIRFDYFYLISTPMNTRLQYLFDQLETQKNKLIGQVGSMDERQLNAAAPGTWSVSQVLAHLIASEQLSVNYLNKKLLGISGYEDSGMMEEAKMLILVLSQRLPFKFKAPRMVVENTSPFHSREALIRAWDTTRLELRQVLEKFTDDQITRKVFKHPRAGMLNIQHALRFFREHIIHHQPQIKRLLKGT